MTRPRTFAEAETALAQTLPGYTPRVQQQRLAAFVEDVIADNGHGLAEAGCGTGKSLAVMIPAILAGKRVVVSTATIALMSQYASKDAPFLQEHLGVPFTFALVKGRSNYMCFRAGTRVLTWDGAKPIEELAEQGMATVLDGNGDWTKAEIKAFGKQRLMRLLLTRDGREKVVYVTPEHRWFVNPNANRVVVREETTATLCPGDKLAYAGPRSVVATSRVVPSPFGIAHGIAFGDGTVFRCASNRRGGSGTVVLHGAKKELVRYFPLNRTQEEILPDDYAEVSATRVYDLPTAYSTDLPSMDESASYLYGWLVGLFATDGSVSRGSLVITSASRLVLQHVRDVCTRLGIVTYPIREDTRVGINQFEPSSIFSVGLAQETVGDDFVVRSDQVADFDAYLSRRTYKQWRTARRWTVVSIEQTDVVEEVYCAVVPTTESFVLEDNILTGNCRAKTAKVEPGKVPALAQMLAEIEADPDHSGDLEDFAAEVTKEEFSYVSMSGAECPGKKQCPFGEICFAEKAKAKGREAQVVVTNTAMLMTDLKVREMSEGNADMLGQYDMVLLDEAHELEEIATNQLSEQMREKGLRMMVAEAENFAAAQNAKVASAETVSAALTTVWSLLADDGRRTMSWFLEHQDAFVDLVNSLYDLADEVAEIRIVRGDQKALHAQQVMLGGKIGSAARKFQEAVTTDDHVMVRWVETDSTRKTGPVKVFRTAPLSVAAYLNTWLWSQTSAVLVSATLSMRGDFSFMTERLGLPATAQSLSVGTPFDYSTQALLFIPDRAAPNPSKERAAWMSYAPAMTMELVRRSKGSALLLFTSRSAMTAAYETLSPQMADLGLTVLMQGWSGSNRQVAEQFTADTTSVLFALKSFMTGVDFQGDTLRLVVIDKLPFPVPTEPVFAARCEELDRKRPGSSFRSMVVPSMCLTLNQAYGRLIRTATDRGVVAILDSRLTTTGYGKGIIASLPPSPQTSSLVEVADFFG